MIKRALNTLTASHAITAASQLSRTAYVLLMLVLVPVFLTGAEQGYWFSFMSFSALMIIADSGFSTIILQFAAHEFAFLKFNQAGDLEGDAERLRRLGGFFLFALKWSAGVAAAALPLIAGIGWTIMSRRPPEADWQAPWLLYMLGSVFAFMNNGLLYFFEGCDSVPKTQKIRAQMNAAMIAALVLGLAGGMKLYALAFAAFAGAAVAAAGLYAVFGRAAAALLSAAKDCAHSWRGEFLPLLGKYSLSWASGYFIFQMYTPIMFHFYGPVAAGKIGISITLWTGVLTLSNIWLSVVTPKMNMHISKKEWGSLDRLFFRNLGLSAGTFFFGAVCAFSLLGAARGHFAFADRFLDLVPMLFLAAGWGLQVVVNGLAIYLRAHKEEPLVVPSVVSAVYIIAATWLSAVFLSPDYFFLGFFSSYLWGLPWVVQIFNKKRREGHSAA